MKQTVVIYGRISSDEQRDNNSIGAQMFGCQGWIKPDDFALVGDRFVDPLTGYEVDPDTPGAVRAFVDVESGFTDRRPAFYAMIDFLKREGADIVLCWHFDRMARSLETYHAIDLAIEKAGANVHFVTGPNFDRDSAQGRLSRAVSLAIAEFEIAHRNERMAAAKDELARRGRHPSGKAPYGYVLDTEGTNPESKGGLVIREDQAAVVRKMFADYLAGKSLNQIIGWLNEAKIPPPLRGKWSASQVHRMFRREVYAGRGYWRMSKRSRSDPGNVPLPREQWIGFEVPPLVSREEWSRVQDMLDHNRMLRRKQPKRDYLLSGMIVCSECGHAYVGETDPAGSGGRVTDGVRYIHRKRYGHCSNVSVNGPAIESLVWESVRQTLLDPERLAQGYEQSLGRGGDALLERLVAVKARLDRLEAKKARLLDLYLEGQFSKAQLDAKSAEIDRKIAADERRRHDLQDAIDDGPTPEKIETLRQFADTVRGYLSADVSIADKRHILKLMHLRVERSLDGAISLPGWFVVGAEADQSKIGEIISRYR